MLWWFQMGTMGSLAEKIPFVECPDDDYVATHARLVAESRR